LILEGAARQDHCLVAFIDCHDFVLRWCYKERFFSDGKVKFKEALFD
jgi:hypothetical protein